MDQMALDKGVVAGGMAREVLLSDSFVHPRRTLGLGFQFRFERPELALTDLL